MINTSEVGAPLGLTEAAPKSVQKWLEQIFNHCQLTSDHQHLSRHPRHQLDVGMRTPKFVPVNFHPREIIGLLRCFIDKTIGGDVSYDTVDPWHLAARIRRKVNFRGQAGMNDVDVIW